MNQPNPNPNSGRFDRRCFFSRSLLGLGAVALGGGFARSALGAEAKASSVPARLDFESETYPFELPPLPYAYDALQPSIDARTMEIHYTKHHAGYVRKLNAALEGHPELHDLTLGELLTNLDDVPESIRTAVRNNGGGHLNHCLFWYSLSPVDSPPSDELETKIVVFSGGREALLEKMVNAGLGRFGSGWAWLCLTPEGDLSILSTPNQDSPWMQNSELRPLLGVDVWEHAYYLKYQNRRGDYLRAWTGLVDWAAVSERLAS